MKLRSDHAVTSAVAAVLKSVEEAVLVADLRDAMHRAVIKVLKARGMRARRLLEK